MPPRTQTSLERQTYPISSLSNVDLVKHLSDWLSQPVSDHSTEYVTDFGAAVGSSIGLVRKRNEDRAVIVRYTPAGSTNDPFVSFIVCDGMGGMKEGETCAMLTAAHFIGSMVTDTSPARTRTRNATMRANDAVYARYRGEGGSTLSAVVIDKHGIAFCVHTGDSRIYLFSKDNARDPLRLITKDDTIAARLHELRGISRTEASEIPYSEGLAQFIGIGTGLQPQYEEFRVQGKVKGLLLSTDGVHAAVGEQLSPILWHASDARDAAQKLLLSARWTGGRDNASLIFCTDAQEAIPQQHGTAGSTTRPRLEMWDCDGKLDLVFDTIFPREPKEYTDKRAMRQTAAEGLQPDLLGPGSGAADVRKTKGRKSTKEQKRSTGQKGRKSQKQPELNVQFVPGNGDKETD